MCAPLHSVIMSLSSLIKWFIFVHIMFHIGDARKKRHVIFDSRLPLFDPSSVKLNQAQYRWGWKFPLPNLWNVFCEIENSTKNKNVG